jgi:hypothetical protein
MNLSQLVLPQAGQKFQASDFRDLLKPGVYLFMRGGLPLYIGMGKRLLGRIGGLHKQAGLAIEECDEVLMYPCVSLKAATELETLLIGQLRPRYNKQRNKYAANILGLRQVRT